METRAFVRLPKTGPTSHLSDTSGRRWIILAHPIAASLEGHEPEINALAARAGMDPFVARQGLVGHSFQILASEYEQSRLKPQVANLRQAGISCALVPAPTDSESGRIPQSKKVAVSASAIVLFSAEDTPLFTITDTSRVIAVIGSLDESRFGSNQDIASLLLRGKMCEPLSLEKRIEEIAPHRPAILIASADGNTVVWIDLGQVTVETDDHRSFLTSREKLDCLISILQSFSGVTFDTHFGTRLLPIGSLDSPPENRLACAERFRLYGALASLAYTHAAATPQTLSDSPHLGLLATVMTSRLEEVSPELLSSLSASGVMTRPEQFRTIHYKSGAETLAIFLRRIGHPTLVIPVLISSILGPLGALPGGWSSVPVSIGALMLLHAITTYLWKRTFDRAPLSRPRSLAMGTVKVSGVIAPVGTALIAPHSLTRCVYYETKTLRRKTFATSKVSSESWVVESRSASPREPFYLTDGDHRVLIDFPNAHVDCLIEEEFSASIAEIVTQSRSDGDRKIIELCLPVDETALALGFARPSRNGRQSIADRTIGKLSALKKNTAALLEYDTNRDGSISIEEFASARHDMENASVKESLENSILKTGDIPIVGPMPSGQPLFITAGSSRYISWRLILRASCFALAGSVLLWIYLPDLIKSTSN